MIKRYFIWVLHALALEPPSHRLAFLFFVFGSLLVGLFETMEKSSFQETESHDFSKATPLPSFKLTTDNSGIEIGQWTICSVKNPIANTSVEDQLSKELDIKLPSMLFDRSLLEFVHNTHTGTQPDTTSKDGQFQLTFDAVSALRMVGTADPNIKVKVAARWASNKARDDVEIMTLTHASDWTFSTKYGGTINVTDESGRIKSSKSATSSDLVGVDYDALRDTNLPILFSSEVILFEDELDDNGTASYKVRVRVMPSFFFVLARFFLRVDDVYIRIYDTRYFHRFGSPLIVRETVHREVSLATALRHVHSSVLRDADTIAPQVPMVFNGLDNIFI